MSLQPVPGTQFALRTLERAAPWSPIWPCTRWGFPCLLARARSGGLLLHLFTLTILKLKMAVCFLWHYPSGCLTASPPACIPQSAFLRRQPQVTRHRALWCSDFPPPRNYSGERFSAFPKSPLIYGKNVRTQVDCKFPDQSATARSMSRL